VVSGWIVASWTRSSNVLVQVRPYRRQRPCRLSRRPRRHLGQRYEDNRGHGYKKKKKESFLSELFDF
jgi:Zn-finger nucleic acid-binding protein